MYIVLNLSDRFADELGVFVPNEAAPPDVFALGPGFENPFGGPPDGMPRDAPQMFWRGMVRPNRRHGPGMTKFLHHRKLH